MAGPGRVIEEGAIEPLIASVLGHDAGCIGNIGGDPNG